MWNTFENLKKNGLANSRKGTALALQKKQRFIL